MDLPADIFDAPVRPDLLHAAVVQQRNKLRAGTHATKSRAQVSGGGAKPYRQKGTGRARQGTTRAPQWTGGGIVFGPQPRSYATKLPKKVRRAALKSALSLRKSEDRVHVEALALAEPRTKLLRQRLEGLGIADCLIVTRERDRNLELASRNLPHVKVLCVAGLNVRDVLAREQLVIAPDAVGAIAERLA